MKSRRLECRSLILHPSFIPHPSSHDSEFPMPSRWWIRNTFNRPVPRTIRKAPRRVSLALEALEDRRCPTVYTVLNTLGDGSVDSLGWAVGQANTHAGADTIAFDSTAFSTAQTITLGGSQLELT